MGFDGQAFATAFLNSLSGGIQERVKEAKEFGDSNVFTKADKINRLLNDIIGDYK